MEKLFLISCLLMVFITGCREDIISPENTGGNVNEPVLSTSRDIYSFSLNAQNITESVTNNSDLNTFFNQLYISISDYQSGYVDVRVINKGGDLLYQNRLNSNVNGLYTRINGAVPSRIEIEFNNFTARMKFEISPTQ